jgi:hypothetical protein
MANELYLPFKQVILEPDTITPAGGLDLMQHGIKATLVDAGAYTWANTHSEYGSGTPDVPDASKIAVSPNLVTPNVDDGVFDSADFTWSAVTGVNCENIVVWDDDITAPVIDHLICNFDTGITCYRTVATST